MSLIVVGTPSNFTCTGSGTEADPFVVASTNHSDSSFAEIIFLATTNGMVSPDLVVSSQENYDFALVLNNQTIFIQSGNATFSDPFAVSAGDQVKLQYIKDPSTSVGDDDFTGTIFFSLSVTTTTTTTTFNPIRFFYSSKNLYIRGSGLNEKIDFNIYSVGNSIGLKVLYLNSKIQEYFNLYTNSNINNTLNFLIKSVYEHEDDIDLYLKSLTELTMPLYVFSTATPAIDENLKFNIYGSLVDLKTESLQLYINNILQEPLQIFLKVDNKELVYSSMNFIIDGQIINLSENASLNLYVSNQYKSENSSLNITIIGLGTTFNGIPSDSSMNLFVERDVEATWNSVPLIIYASSSAITNSIDFNIYPNDIYYESLNLNIPSTNQPFDGNIQLYTHGFED